MVKQSAKRGSKVVSGVYRPSIRILWGGEAFIEKLVYGVFTGGLWNSARLV
jgi:hypothetical protein